MCLYNFKSVSIPKIECIKIFRMGYDGLLSSLHMGVEEYQLGVVYQVKNPEQRIHTWDRDHKNKMAYMSYPRGYHAYMAWQLPMLLTVPYMICSCMIYDVHTMGKYQGLNACAGYGMLIHKAIYMQDKVFVSDGRGMSDLVPKATAEKLLIQNQSCQK